MGLRKVSILSLLLFMPITNIAVPLIQKITNESDFGFLVVMHTDSSSCSLQNSKIIIDAHTIFTYDFLLELGRPRLDFEPIYYTDFRTGQELVPSLALRPIYYLDKKTKEKIMLVDDAHNYDMALIDKAFKLWKQSNKFKKKFKTADVWLNHFVGKDLMVISQEVEMLGYLNNQSRVTIKNQTQQHAKWLSFSKGIFSKLILELELQQHAYHGVLGKVHVFHGEGGVCFQGSVERI